MFVCLVACVRGCLFVCLIDCLCACLLGCLFLCVVVCLLRCLFVILVYSLLACLFVCLVVCLFVWLFVWFGVLCSCFVVLLVCRCVVLLVRIQTGPPPGNAWKPLRTLCAGHTPRGLAAASTQTDPNGTSPRERVETLAKPMRRAHS